MNAKAPKPRSILNRIFIPILAVMLLQIGVFAGGILWGGTIKNLDQNAFDILNEKVVGRKNYLQNEMLQRWSNLEESAQNVNALVEKILLQNNADYKSMTADSQLAVDILDAAAQDIVYLLRKNSVTGAFLVLNGNDPNGVPTGAQKVEKAGLYLRDLDPVSTPRDNSDLLIERAPSVITRKMNIPMDTGWMPRFQFTEKSAKDFFYRPYLAAKQYPEIYYRDLGYWSKPYLLTDDDRPVISYSIPLLSKNNEPYAVLGIEVTLDYLRKMLPYEEIAQEKKGAYLLAVTQDGKTFEDVFSNGPMYKKNFGTDKTTRLKAQTLYSGTYELDTASPCYGDVQYLKLYNSNTPFENEKWALFGVMEQQTMLSFSRNVRLTVLLSLLFSVLLGVIGLFLVGRWVTAPISTLVSKLKESPTDKPLSLPKIQVGEIDELAYEIEHLSARVMEYSSKLTHIINLANVPIGAFEWQNSSDGVFYTENFFPMLGLNRPNEQRDTNRMTYAQFRQKLDELKPYQFEQEPENVVIYRLPATKTGARRWLRMKTVEDDTQVLGVVSDITQEMEEKRRLEYERDYDLLTSLLNRRAFQVKMHELFAMPEKLKIGALVMLDLDNLKQVNDTYGHDIGDAYIRFAGAVLKRNSPCNAIVSRMSGDEFYVFFYGYENKKTACEALMQLRRGILEETANLPSKGISTVQASAGVAWYPQDSHQSEELIRFADFAMYRVKRTGKGCFAEFDRKTYDEENRHKEGQRAIE